MRAYETRVEVETSLVWAKENPSLFVESVIKFQEDYPADTWHHTVDLARKGFITLAAELEVDP